MRTKKRVALMIPILLFGGCQPASQTAQFPGDKIREFASSLYNNQLYDQAIEQYNFYLENYDIDETEAANINYTIANIYFERVRDYRNALGYYLKIKNLYPNSPMLDDTNKKIVACLERLGQSADAQQALAESAQLDPSQNRPSRPGEVIAKIGRRQITTGDLNYEINQLPPYIRTQVSDRNQKIDFLKQYIATELFYDKARREGLDKDQAVIDGAFQAKKNLMVQKLLEKEISEQVNVTQSDVELYYKANQEKYAQRDDEGQVVGVKPLDEVRTQVMQDVIRTKQQDAYEMLVQRTMRAEAVEIYDDKL